jgi:hypothetical protein
MVYSVGETPAGSIELKLVSDVNFAEKVLTD